MRLRSLSVCGFRAFNEPQELDLSDPFVILEGPNGSGKTSIGEAVEWLLYGQTLKRMKGNELSKLEYSGCYRNMHYTGAMAPYAEVEIEDSAGRVRKIRRELKEDETSLLKIDGVEAQDLKVFDVDHLHDRPLILQHTLQDFIFMKPKARYQVLSVMLGLEPLIALRNKVETAKTQFGKQLSGAVIQAQNRRGVLMAEVRQEPVLAPVFALAEAGKLDAARQHLDQVALGLVPSGTKVSELLNALKAAKASKERAQLDWGRFSARVIASPAKTEAVLSIASLEEQLARVRNYLREAVTMEPVAGGRQQDPQHRQFYELGLHLLDPAHSSSCPFCQADSLTPERVAALREATSGTLQGQSAIRRALEELREFRTTLVSQVGELKRLVPNQPAEADAETIRGLGGSIAEAYLQSSQSLSGQLTRYDEAFGNLDESHKTVESALSSGGVPKKAEGLTADLQRYKAEVNVLPAVINAYAASYSQLDPVIRERLASAADVRKIERTIKAIEQWKDVQVSQSVLEIDRNFVELIGKIRAFTAKKQKEVLAIRDSEIKAWYGILNPASDVVYDGIAPGNDKLELKAKSYSKTMFAAPNLSTSQLNCVGLSVYLACATRKGTPFTTLLIDDPVQSMDDEHTEAFKKQVIARLLDKGFHVVVLTHMQLLAGDMELLYRNKGAALFKMSEYSRSGPAIDWKGPQVVRLLESARRNKDGNEQYRKQAMLDLRMFIERFAKDFFKMQTGETSSKRYEDKNWSALKDLLKRCPAFDAVDEPKFEDTHAFTSRHLHADDRMPQPVPSGSQITPHYREMKDLLDKYKPTLEIPYPNSRIPAAT